MLKRLLYPLLFLTGTCAAPADTDGAVDAAFTPPPVAGAQSLPPDPDDIPAPLTEAEITGVSDDPMEGLSAVQRGQVEKELVKHAGKAGVLGGRIGVSEAGFEGALKDLPGIYEVAANRRKKKESLWDALASLSPHVARVKHPTRPRQLWTSSLPATGNDMPAGWKECTSWYEDKRGRRRGLPKGCVGAWANVQAKWVEVREFSIRAAARQEDAIPGTPWTWGGDMDVARFLRRNPHMCILSRPPDTHNHFFGKRADNQDFCLEPTEEKLARSRKLWDGIVRADEKRGIVAIPAALAAARK